jgi:hypothetical protein
MHHIVTRLIVNPTRAGVAAVCLLGASTALAAIVDPALDDTNKPWCYFTHPVTCIGMPWQPDAIGIQVTPEGNIFTGRAEFCLFWGKDDKPLACRQRQFLDGFIPVVSDFWTEEDIRYDYEVFGTTLPAGAIRIGQWKANEITTVGKEITLDVTQAIKDEGEYEVTFTYQSGGQRLEIEWVALTVNGNEIMRDTHLAWAGDPVKDNTFRLNPGAMVFNGSYGIRAKVKTAGGNDSNGIITLRRKSN